MKMLTICFDCFEENGYPSLECNTQDITDDGIYKVECSKGHITYQMMRNEKFEVLFDLGADALNNGYKYEAVACFKASLERFYEYFIKVMLIKNKISQEDIKKLGLMYLLSQKDNLELFIFYICKNLKKHQKRKVDLK